MRVYNEEIATVVIDHALSQMELHRGFTCGDLAVALAKSGAPGGPHILYRCADRTLQKLRKMGAIKFASGKWTVAA